MGMPNKRELLWHLEILVSGWFESRLRNGRFRLVFSVDEFEDSSGSSSGAASGDGDISSISAPSLNLNVEID